MAVAGAGDHDAVGIGLAGEAARDRHAGDQRADQAAGEAGELVAAGVEAGDHDDDQRPHHHRTDDLPGAHLPAYDARADEDENAEEGDQPRHVEVFGGEA